MTENRTAVDTDDIQTLLREVIAEKFDHDISQQCKIEKMEQHASARQYFRIKLPPPLSDKGESSIVAMVLPPDAASEEAGSEGECFEERELDFVLISNVLKSLNIRVPNIEFNDKVRRILLLEDLGNRLLEDALLSKPTERIKLYESTIDLLLTLQQNYEAKKPAGIWQTRSFQASILKWELMHFFDWGLEMRLPKEASKLSGPLNIAFDQIVQELEGAYHTFVLRDFQSRNIMEKDGHWVLIDFQDALTGPFCYDLVALLRDSYVSLFPHELEHLLDYYINGCFVRNLPWKNIGSDQIKRIFYLQTLQRKLKDAGRFIFIREVKGNDSFIQYFEPSLEYVSWALEKLNDPAFDAIQKGVQVALSKPV